MNIQRKHRIMIVGPLTAMAALACASIKPELPDIGASGTQLSPSLQQPLSTVEVTMQPKENEYESELDLSVDTHGDSIARDRFQVLAHRPLKLGNGLWLTVFPAGHPGGDPAAAEGQQNLVGGRNTAVKVRALVTSTPQPGEHAPPPSLPAAGAAADRLAVDMALAAGFTSYGIGRGRVVADQSRRSQAARAAS